MTHWNRVRLRPWHLLPLIALLLAFALTSSGALAGRLTDTTAGLQSGANTADSAQQRSAGVLNRYGLSTAPYRGKVLGNAPTIAGAWVELVDPTGGSYCNGCLVDASNPDTPNTFILELWINGGPVDLTGQQSYLTFTNSVLNAVNPANLSSCQLTTQARLDNTAFDTSLQNEICNYGPDCVGQITPLPGLIAFASGAFSNPPQAAPFRVAEIGFCAIADGTATINWQFSAGAPPTGCPSGTAPANRNTRITSQLEGVVSDCTKFTNYSLTFTNVPPGKPPATFTGTATRTATRTRTPTNTRTATRTATSAAGATDTATNTPVSTNTNTPVNTATNTPVNTATNTPVNTATNTPVNTATNTPVNTNTNTPVNTATNTPVNTNTPPPGATNTNTPVNTNTNTPVNTATNTPVNTNTNTPVNTATNTNTPPPGATNTNTPVNTNTNTPVNTATNTPVNTNTNTPVNTATNTRTNTPPPAATNTATNTRTNTPPPAATNTATNTRTNTPPPAATNTATNTRTNTPPPAATNTATNTRTATRTATAVGTGTPCSTCNLRVSVVSISCTADGRVHWTATVQNSGSCTVCAAWKAQLQRHIPGTGGFSPAQSMMDTTCFAPGTTVVNGTSEYDFCYNAPPNVNVVRVEFKINPNEDRCSPKRKSSGMQPCDPDPPCPTLFNDLPTDSPFYGEVVALQSEGVVSGYADGTFRPNGIVTRAQAAKMLAIAFGLDLSGSRGERFSDVPSANPFYAYVEAAAAHGWVSGYADGTFRPNIPVTRAQAAKMVVLAAGYPTANPERPTFADVAAGSTFYPYIETAHAHGLVAGYGDGTFRPGASATRGQIAKIVLNAAYPVED